MDLGKSHITQLEWDAPNLFWRTAKKYEWKEEIAKRCALKETQVTPKRERSFEKIMSCPDDVPSRSARSYLTHIISKGFPAN